ncbi:MAG: O-methyltransferase [Maricaulaceae bacterium]
MSRSIGISEAVEAYVRMANAAETPVLRRCREETQALGDAARMQISPEQGAFLAFLIDLIDARDAVEIGVFTGYSALCCAAAMKANHGPEARLIALDIDSAHMLTSQQYFKAAGLDDVIEMRVGPASESLADLERDGEVGGIDFIFVDADKTGYRDYFEKGLALLRPGGVIAFDNVLWSGDVADPLKTDPDTMALRDLAETVKADDRVDHVFTTIGDGLLMARKKRKLTEA